MSGKLLIFGGAFNPPHKGHGRLLDAARDALSPDVTVLLPTATSPHKCRGDVGFFHRASMLKSLKTDGSVKISEFENQGRKRRNFTLQSVKRIERQYPGYEIYLLIGGDMFESFTSWSRYRRIISRAVLTVAAREPEDGGIEKAAAALKREGARIVFLRLSPLVTSSSELRRMIANGEDAAGYVDKEVLDYIKKHGLYGEDGRK